METRQREALALLPFDFCILPFDVFFPMPTNSKMTLDRVPSRFGIASRTDSRKAIVAVV
jgi:hypothetical protein